MTHIPNLGPKLVKIIPCLQLIQWVQQSHRWYILHLKSGKLNISLHRRMRHCVWLLNQDIYNRNCLEYGLFIWSYARVIANVTVMCHFWWPWTNQCLVYLGGQHIPNLVYDYIRQSLLNIHLHPYTFQWNIRCKFLNSQFYMVHNRTILKKYDPSTIMCLSYIKIDPLLSFHVDVPHNKRWI